MLKGERLILRLHKARWRSDPVLAHVLIYESVAGLSALQTEKYLKQLPDVLSDLCFTTCLLFSNALPARVQAVPVLSVPAASQCLFPTRPPQSPVCASRRYRPELFVSMQRGALTACPASPILDIIRTSTVQPHSSAHTPRYCVDVKGGLEPFVKASGSCANSALWA